MVNIGEHNKEQCQNQTIYQFTISLEEVGASEAKRIVFLN